MLVLGVFGEHLKNGKNWEFGGKNTGKKLGLAQQHTGGQL